MPDLLHTLQGHDLGFLKMVADAWGVEIYAPDVHSALQSLTTALLDADLVVESVQALPRSAQLALQDLLENEGRMSWALFSRRYGEVRVMGAARRDRERPDRSPTSPAETLWYRALIGRAFLTIAPDAPEMAYIPDDLLNLLPPMGKSAEQPWGRPATPGESAQPRPCTDHILDHACTFLAALRSGMPANHELLSFPIPTPALQTLLFSAGLIGLDYQLNPEEVRVFLAAPRAQALASLASAWMESETFNELRLMPGLQAEGNWLNLPRQARQAVLGWLSRLPLNTWWSLPAFVAAIRERNPDFQRPAGDYDSWFIRQESSGQFLRGFAAWDQVDGALIRYLIEGPLHWLGMLDLASPAEGAETTAFRLSAWAEALWHAQPPDGLPAEDAPLNIHSDGILLIPALTQRAVRYQLARFSTWRGMDGSAYRYRLTPQSLARSRQQGLRISQLIQLLRRHSASPLPPRLIHALEDWEKNGAQASLQEATLLRVNSPEILTALRKTSAARYLGEALSPTVVLVNGSGREAVARALLEIGYLPSQEE